MEEDLNTYTNLTEIKETSGVTRLIVVRHAESVANTEGRYQGQTYDTDLSELGKKQALALANRVKNLGIKRIISSPLRRTYQTALEIAKLTDCQVEISSLIIETNHGLWEGKTKEWVKENMSEVFGSWLNSPSLTAFPEGETFMDTFRRAETFLNEFSFEDNTLVVTHDNIVRILVSMANGWTLDDMWKHLIEPASLNFFEFNKIDGKGKLKILKLNDNDHLANLKSDFERHAL